MIAACHVAVQKAYLTEAGDCIALHVCTALHVCIHVVAAKTRPHHVIWQAICQTWLDKLIGPLAVRLYSCPCHGMYSKRLPACAAGT